MEVAAVAAVAVAAVIGAASCSASGRTAQRIADTSLSRAPSTTPAAAVRTAPRPPTPHTVRPVPVRRTSSSPTPRPVGARPPTTASRPGTTSIAAPPSSGPPGTASIAGCPLFPPDNPWRRDVSHDAVDAQSAAWVASIGANLPLRADFSLPISIVPASQARVPITFTAYGSESDPGPYPIPANAQVEDNSDHHLLVASGDCHLYELFGAARAGNGWSAASGAVFDLRSDRLRPAGWTSADAAGLPMIAGLARLAEVQAGAIDHALRFTVARTQRGYISPARHQAGSTTDPNVPPMGARFRLKASFDISRFHGEARVVLTCLQHYGMIVADNGANWFVSGAC